MLLAGVGGGSRGLSMFPGPTGTPPEPNPTPHAFDCRSIDSCAYAAVPPVGGNRPSKVALKYHGRQVPREFSHSMCAVPALCRAL